MSKPSDASEIVENSAARPLSETIRCLLSGAQTVRFAVGYLFVEGLAPLVDELFQVQRTQLLIGNVVNRLTDEQIRESGILTSASTVSLEEFAANYREARNRAATETALNLRHTIHALPRTEENRSLLISLAQLIAGGRLQIRLYTQNRLHAKVTIASYAAGHADAPGAAIVGTSNFSLPVEVTQAAAPSNLDVLLKGAANHKHLTAWFDSHWAEAQDFQKELFEELGRAWPLAESN